MFISNSGCPECRGNNSLTSKCRFENAKIHELCYVMELKTRASCMCSCLTYSWLT